MPDSLPAITPENEKLNEELRRLQAEFLEVFTRHKDMVENEVPILTSLYLEKLGHLQLELLEKQTESSRLRMKMSMIQAALNRDEHPDLQAIEHDLDKALKEYYANIKIQAEDLDRARQVLSSLLTPEETAALKETFRVLVKRLHPDLNPNQSDHERDLFIKVKAAYDRNSLSDLQDILLSLDEPGEDISMTSTSDKIDRIEHLEKQIAGLELKIEKLSQSFPINIKDQILDYEYIKERQEEIKDQISQAEEEIKQFQEIISLMTDE